MHSETEIEFEPFPILLTLKLALWPEILRQRDPEIPLCQYLFREYRFGYDYSRCCPLLMGPAPAISVQTPPKDPTAAALLFQVSPPLKHPA